MRKIPCLFVRDFSVRPHTLLRDITPGCERALAEGMATRKWDGTAAMVRAGRLFKRYDSKNGKPPPPQFEPCEATPDPVTGHWPGWIPVGDGPADKWFREAAPNVQLYPDGTYEMCGPAISANPEELADHRLIPHGRHVVDLPDRSWDGIRLFLALNRIEGLVFWLDGHAVCKIRRGDYGLPWGASR